MENTGGPREIHHVVAANTVEAVLEEELLRPEPEGSPWRLISTGVAFIWELRLVCLQTAPAVVKVVIEKTRVHHSHVIRGIRGPNYGYI